MSSGIIWTICLSIWAVQIIWIYVGTLYCEYRRLKGTRTSWKDKSFAEYVYSDEHPDYDNPLLWVQYLPYFGIMFGILLFFYEYSSSFTLGFWNPIRGILKIILRKKYLLERVSKEI